MITLVIFSLFFTFFKKMALAQKVTELAGTATKT